MSFTENLNYCMTQRDYSAYRLSKIIGSTNQAVLNWQAGKAIPHAKTRQKIADHFGITLAELDGDELPTLPEKGTEKAPAPKEDERPYIDMDTARIWSPHPVAILAAQYKVPTATLQQIIGCDFNMAGNIALGLEAPTDEQLRRVAAAFCVPYGDLMRGWVPLYANRDLSFDNIPRSSDRFPSPEGQ